MIPADAELPTEAASGGRVLRFFSSRLGPIAVFACVALIYVATATPGSVSSRDTLTANVAAWVLAVHHTLDLGHLSIALAHPSVLWVVPGAHGSIVSNRFPGAVLMAVPFYALAGGSYSAIPAAVAAALAAAGACAILYKVLLSLQPPKIALAATGLFAFGTSQWTVSGHELWQHSGSSLLIAAGMWALFRRRWLLSGLALGSTVLFRPHLGLAVAVVCIGLVWLEHRWRPAILVGLAAVPGVLAFFAWNWVAYGKFTIAGGYDAAGGRPISVGGVGVLGFLDNIAGTLISPERGLLICSPVFVLALIGLRAGWRSSSRMVKVLALAGLAYLASQLWLIRFSGGDGFYGYRVCLESVVYAAPLLVESAAYGFRKVGSLGSWVLITISVAFFSAGAFSLGEVLGVANPWTTWTPLQLETTYGPFRVIVGGLVGVGAVFVAWWISRRFHASSNSPTSASFSRAPTRNLDATTVLRS